MRLAAMTVFAAALLAFVATTPASADLSTYSQDFEGLVQADPNALANDGWLIFGNVFYPDWSYWYGYGPFPAPNNPAAPGFCLIASGQGGPAQGAQQLVVFSDYNNTDHPAAWIESNVFQEQIIGAADVGNTWLFEFDAKLGDIALQSTATAFIKVLDPNAGFSLSRFVTVDMTSIPVTWGTYGLQLTMDPELEGQILQIGFLNVATNYEPSGIFYDNVNFSEMPPVSVEDTTWGQLKALYR